MKSTEELVKGTEWGFRARARTVARAGEREGMLKAAGEIGELLTAEAERLQASGEKPGEFWGNVQAWYKATTETTGEGA